MEAKPLEDLSKLCIHTITTKPWPIEVAADHYTRAGVTGISVWKEALAGRNIKKTGQMLRDAGLTIVSYVRGGFFPAAQALFAEGQRGNIFNLALEKLAIIPCCF